MIQEGSLRGVENYEIESQSKSQEADHFHELHRQSIEDKQKDVAS